MPFWWDLLNILKPNPNAPAESLRSDRGTRKHPHPVTARECDEIASLLDSYVLESHSNGLNLVSHFVCICQLCGTSLPLLLQQDS